MVTHCRATTALLALAVGLTAMPALGRDAAGTSDSSDISPTPLVNNVVVEARRAFREGVDQARAGQFASAVAAFERSLALHPHAATLWNLAASELELGNLSAARIHFREALQRAARDPNELDASRRTAAEVRLAELELRVDSEAEVSSRNALAKRNSRRINNVNRAAHHSAPPVPSSEGTLASAWQLPAFGLAAAGAVSTLIFGVLAVNAVSDLDKMCPERSRCPVGSSSRRDELVRYATLADISLAFTLVAAGAGLYVTIVPPSTGVQSGGGVVVTHAF